jgi:phage-related minor tail protein
MFQMAGGRRGLAGEAGEEGILPLTRTSGGDLGVKAQGVGGHVEVNVFAPEGSSVTQERKSDGNKEIINIMIDEAVAKNISTTGSRTNKALRGTFGVSQVLTSR